MNRRLVVLPRAEAEVNDAAAWYARQNPSSAVKFNDSFEAALTRLGENPLQYQIVHGETRRAPLRGFPYGLLYVIDEEAVIVLSCFHASRDPAWWPGLRK
jgi:plasmid stabilization system protein ParE